MRSFQLVLSLVIVVAPTCRAAPACESCLFDRDPSLEVDCSVYGAPTPNQLVPWYRAPEACLATLNISLAAVDKVNMWEICPSMNGTDVNIERLTSLLRYTESNASNAVKGTVVCSNVHLSQKSNKDHGTK
jgi:hypothetical protein